MKSSQIYFCLVLVSSGVSPQGLAFEHTRVLPSGVRSVNIRSVDTELGTKTDGDGRARPLADPLRQELTFRRVAKDEAPVRAEQLRAFLLSNGFGFEESIGTFTADLKGRLSVVAPIMSYGVTDHLTLALAVPYYRAQTAINVGFVPNETAKSFLTALSQPHNNQGASAREALGKFNAAVSRLNDKLAKNGFASLSRWEESGLGDMTIAGKHQTLRAGPLTLATTGGVVAPTGRPDDPDILTDLPFGDGQWDVFGQVTVDESVISGITLNQYVKYTAQLPGEKTVRLVTDDEKIETGSGRTRFKLGDRVESGAALLWEPRFGLTTGVGVGIVRKYADQYQGLPEETRTVLERDTGATAQIAEWTVGYSTVPLYQDGAVAVPFEVRLTQVRQLASRNTPVTGLTQVDVSVFF